MTDPLLTFSRAWSRYVEQMDFPGRDRLSRLPLIPARLDRSGEWYSCEGCGVRQQAGGVPAFYQPDGRRFCFACHNMGPERARRHYKKFWEPGESNRWPEDLVGEQ